MFEALLIFVLTGEHFLRKNVQPFGLTFFIGTRFSYTSICATLQIRIEQENADHGNVAFFAGEITDVFLLFG